MRKTLTILFLLILLYSSPCNCQNYNNIISTISESTHDTTIFQHCIDSISKYVYIDSRKIKPYMDAAEEILSKESDLPSRLKLDLIIQRIYNQYNYDDNLGIFQIIENNREMLELEGIPTKQKNHFKYLEGYTLMTLGEIDNAQEIFYELLDIAIENKDTSLMMQSISSLGKLYGQQDDYTNAEKYLLEFSSLIPAKKTSHRATYYIELVQLYIDSKQYDKAEFYNELALKYADSTDLVDIQIDYLLQKVEICLIKENPAKAVKAYEKAKEIEKNIGNPNYLKRCRLAYAKILEYKNQYNESLSIYEGFIKQGEDGEFSRSELLNYYQSASEIANKNKSFDKAFQYLAKADEISDNLFIEEQKIKSQYLQIKFDADKKQKENEILNSQILKEKAQNRLLYALSALFLISSLFLFFAFFQKRNYNKTLEHKVNDRTSELVNTNKSLKKVNSELSDLTYALSHDLKEPLITLVQFSELAKNELNQLDLNPKNNIQEYLEFINNSGNRLKLLIDDISSFQLVKRNGKENLTIVDTNDLIKSVSDSILSLINEKNAVINYNNLPSITSQKTLLFSVFKNLIENGIKYNKSNLPTIDIEYDKSNGFHIFNVKDNGIGIEPKYQENIFSMFKRLHNRQEYAGSGLGLNIVKKIVEQFGGSINVLNSDLGKGSCFQVKLPILDSTK